MNSSSENTSSSKQIPVKRNRFWLKFLSTLALVLLLVWLIPNLFSHYLFNTVIKKAFSELTKQQYALNFEDLKINIITRKITFLSTHIYSSKQGENSRHPRLNFYSDTLRFYNIDFESLLKNKTLKLENIYLNRLQLEIVEQEEKADQDLNLPLSNGYFEGFQVKDIKVRKAIIKYKRKLDSIYIPDLNFQLQHLQIDSLKDTVKSNRFHFNDINLVVKNQRLQVADKSHLLSWKHLRLSTTEKFIELDNFKITPEKSARKQTNYSADIQKIRLDNIELDSLIKNKQLLAKRFILDINHFDIQLQNSSRKSKGVSFKKQLDLFFQNNFSKIAIDSSQITIAESRVKLPKKQTLNFSGKSKLQLDNFQFNPENKTRFSLTNGSIRLNKASFFNALNKQKVQVEKGEVNYNKQSLSLFGINFISDSNAKYKLELEEFQLKNIDWIRFLNTDKLLAKKLLLKRGDFTQQYAEDKEDSPSNFQKTDSLLAHFIPLIKIKNIELENWNYKLASKATDAKDINIQIYDFQLPGDSSLAFRAFSNFDTKINQLSWLSKDQGHHYLANNIEANSQTQHIDIQKIQSFPRWKTLENKAIGEQARFKIFADNIKIITSKSFRKINLTDSLQLSQLSIDSLNLKQYGKTIDKERSESGTPLLLIASFELRKGNFAAYNDSSILSRLAQLNGIHLQGDSLEIDSDSLFSIKYKHLLAITENGFYQNEAQGLSFNFQKIDFDSEDEIVGLHQLKAELSSEKNGKSTLHKLNSKLAEITGFDHNLFLQRHLISAKEFKVDAPVLISKSHSEKKEANNFRALFSAEKISQIPYLKFDRFIIHDFTWLATYTVQGLTNITSFEKANFEILDFRLSHRSFINPERLFFSKAIDFQIGNFKQHLSNGNYLLEVADIHFSSQKKQLDFSKILFYTLQKEKQNNYNFSIDHISFRAINFADFQRNFSLSIGSIIVENPKTNLRLFGFEENTSVKNLNTQGIYPILKPYFSQITLDKIDVRDMHLKLEIPKGNSTNTYNLGHLNLQMFDFKLDSTNEAFQNNRFFYTKNTEVHLRDYSAHIENDLYRVNFKNLRLSTLNEIIAIDTFTLKPQYNYADFASQVGYQTDRFDLDINKIKLEGIDFQDAIFRQKYSVRKVVINQLAGETYRDGLYPRRPNYQPKTPLQRLLALPYFIQVDTLLLNNSYFAYKEKGKNTENPGHIFFNQLNAQILNITNNPDFIKFGGNTVLHAQALLMGKGKVNLDANFPLSEQGKVFKLNASLSQIEMDDLEPILRPLALIQARSGTIKSVELSVEANDDYAFGNMLMLYNNMKVVVLNKSMKKGFWGTLMANAIIKTENPSYLIPRKGPIYFERNKERSLFNYWAEISILGMKTSMGLADRRTAKKVKKLQKK